MKLEKMPKQTKRRKKRVGRGYGSGKGGHTVGRGQKGLKSRNKVGLLFEGTKIKKSLLKRLPLLRGKGKLKPKKKPLLVSLGKLETLPPGSKVNLKTLIDHGLVDGKKALALGVKILAKGKLSKALVLDLPVSKGARKKIEEAGGKVVEAKESIKKQKDK